MPSIRIQLFEAMQGSTPENPRRLTALGKATGLSHRIIIDTMIILEEEGLIGDANPPKGEFDFIRDPKWYLVTHEAISSAVGGSRKEERE